MEDILTSAEVNLELIVLKLNGKKIMLNECDEKELKDLLEGSDGNGYYGTGFTITVSKK